jgi:double zinc ribbon protein
MSERRCPACGALVAVDAEWCGQCYASLRESSRGHAAPAAATPAATASPRTAADTLGGGPGDGPSSGWRCPTCDAENDLDANACAVCGTPFGRLFEDPAPVPAVSAGAAAAWSLLLPGLGHWFAGRRAEGVARFVLAAWVGGMLLILLASRSGADGLGPTGALVALFGLAAVALWAESAVDARRAVAGLPPVVSSRAILWACVALVGLSILLATVLTLPGLRSVGPAGPPQ